MCNLKGLISMNNLSFFIEIIEDSQVSHIANYSQVKQSLPYIMYKNESKILV